MSVNADHSTGSGNSGVSDVYTVRYYFGLYFKPHYTIYMQNSKQWSIMLLRIGLSAGFASAVLSRLGLWGEYSSGWSRFLEYTGALLSFLPEGLIPIMAIASTALESFFAIVLLVGYRTRLMACATGCLTAIFAVCMTISFGLKESLDYSVFAVSASCFLLAVQEQMGWSIGSVFKKTSEPFR